MTTASFKTGPENIMGNYIWKYHNNVITLRKLIAMTATVVRIGNSNGIVIPAKLLKSLALSERDCVEMKECNGGLFLKKISNGDTRTPFTVLDEWNASNGFSEEFSLESTLEYIDSIQSERKNKSVPGW